MLYVAYVIALTYLVAITASFIHGLQNRNAP